SATLPSFIFLVSIRPPPCSIPVPYTTLFRSFHFNLSHHTVIFMFEVMAMEHINTLLLKLHSYFYCLIRLYGNSIFPALLIFRWFFSISGKYFILSPVNMKLMDHPSHFIRLIINFPYFGIPLFLGEINSVRIKLLPIYRYFIHHSIEFHLLCYGQILFFICNGKVIHLVRKVAILSLLIRNLKW